MYVAFASHGRRLELCGENLKSLMYPKQTMEAERYILTIYKDDVNRLLKNKRLMKYVEDGKLDVILAPVNLKTNNKLFWACQMYCKLPIVAVDDDIIYKPHTLNYLYDHFLANPTCVFGIHAINAQYNIPIKRWSRKILTKTTGPALNVYTYGGDGVIYPPGFKDAYVPYFDYIKNNEELQLNDDHVLHWVKHQNDIKTIAKYGNSDDAGILQHLMKLHAINPTHVAGMPFTKEQRCINILQQIYHIE